jgi:diguanylate cyclase (GGDEF)-like protein
MHAAFSARRAFDRSPVIAEMRRLRDTLLQDPRVPVSCRARHRDLVLGRMRGLALVLMVLTLAWIPIDALWVGASYAATAAPVRVVLAVALWAWSRLCGRLSLELAVTGFVWLQAIGFGILQMEIVDAHAGALQIGYGLFPFILTAQLALLALPWPRTLLAGLAPGVQLALVLWMAPPALGAMWSDVWLFMLILVLATWTGDAQRRLLVGLLDARHDASHDALTGLANRRSAEERLEAALADAERHHEPLSVLVLDLDHFKRINDRHGHAAGDHVLQAVGRILHQELRGGDLGARYGGEEFLVLLPHCAGEQAREIAERIRERIGAMRIQVDGKVLRITVSIGVSSLAPGESMATLLVHGDAALYAAKSGGRNRCVTAPARPQAVLPLSLRTDGDRLPSPANPLPELR